jgi:hypothetical protein
MPELFSERYSPTGGAAAEGVRNQLGRPAMQPLELLIREAVQNCWDARRDDVETVSVEMSLLELDDGASQELRGWLLRSPPPDVPLRDAISEGSITLLAIADRGTLGLAGPIRADQLTDGPTDFVDFVRNIGVPPEREISGGSFGYGKGAFFLCSRANAVIVHTLCEWAGALESRFIACGLGTHHQRGGHPYTGRHWWGRLAEDGIVDPLVGQEAEEAARRLSLPNRSGPNSLGTTVVSVAPRLVVGTGAGAADAGEEMELTPLETAQHIAECIAWNFWPKIVERGGPPAMRFSVSVNGEEVPVPDPVEHPALSGFVRALRRLDGGESTSDALGELREIRGRRPRRDIGRLGLERISLSGQESDWRRPIGAPPAGGPIHHVALMRQPELLVRYLRGPEPPVEGVGYAGAFRCNAEVDGAFRASEPPAHDDWVVDSLSGDERRIVSVGLRRVDAEVRDFASPDMLLAEDEGAIPLGELSRELGGLLVSMEGPGAETRTPPTLGRRGGQRRAGQDARAEIVVGPRPVSTDSGSLIEAVVKFEGPSAGVRAVANTGVATLDGGVMESEPPAGAFEPAILGWVGPDGSQVRSDEAEIRDPDAGAWRVYATHHPDVMVGLDVRAEAL